MSDDNMKKIEQALRTAYQQSESPVPPGEHWRRQVMERICAVEETVQFPQSEPFSVPTLFSGATRILDVSPAMVWGFATACSLCAIVVGAVAFYSSSGLDPYMFSIIVDDPVFETLALLAL
jgi:hypothetical protein